MGSNMLDRHICLFADFVRKQVTDEALWENAIKEFYKALNAESQKSNLEQAVTDKRSWYLPIECKFKLLEKAKAVGCDSFEFWKDYYSYRATYLDPDDPERPFALEMANGKFL